MKVSVAFFTVTETDAVAALYVDAAKGDVEDRKSFDDKDEIEDVWNELKIQIEYVKSNNLAVLEYYKAFQKVEPYCNYPEIRQRIQEEIDTYE